MPRLGEESIRITAVRPTDIREIHAAYNRLGDAGRRHFHPGFLGSEALSPRGIAGRLLLRVSARPLGLRVLRTLRIAPFLIAAVARTESSISGFAFVLVRKMTRPGTFGVFVLPGSEGRGVGSRLTESVLREAEHMGLQEVELTVQADNDRARRLYEGQGFVIVETVPRGDRYRGCAYDYYRMLLRFAERPDHHEDRTSS